MAIAACCSLHDFSDGVRGFRAFFTGPLYQAAVGIMLVGIPGDIAFGGRVLRGEGEALELAGLNAVAGGDPADFVAVNGYLPARYGFVLLELGACRNAQIHLYGSYIFLGRHFECIGLPCPCR
ncbi:hypothetical protein D3C73_1091990 [compost metagenome]